MRSLILLFCCLLAAGTATASANPSEEAAYRAVARAFGDGFYERAEREFGEFISAFPRSERVPEAILLQAQCRFKLKQYDAVIALLNENFERAGRWADQYRFWLAESYFQKADYPNAAREYALLAEEFPRSPRALEALYGQALSLYESGQYAEVIKVLGGPGAFQQAVESKSGEEMVIRGLMLLGEAMFARKDYKAAEDVVRRLPVQPASPELNWRRQNLLCRIQLADGRMEEARQGIPQLMELAKAAGQRPLLSESYDLQGEILERLNLPAAAVEAYEQNLVEAASPRRRRQALLKIIELTLAQNKPAETVQRLEQFIASNPQEAALDLARLTIGELKLKEYYQLKEAAGGSKTAEARPAAETNLLSQAQQHFDKLISDFPESPLLGKACLDRGWCLWEAGKIMESQADFKAAWEKLPHGADKAVAGFKWADTQFQLKDFSGAVTNYQRVVQDFAGLKEVKDSLVEQALYQIVHAAVAVEDLTLASSAMRQVLETYPESHLADRGMLLVGQALNNKGRSARARAVFLEFLKRFPESDLAPEVYLAIARTYKQENDWPAAVGIYENWVQKFPAHPSRARAEFDLAWLNYRAGHETNALSIFTNFVSRYPTNSLAPVAQNWVANYFFTEGDYVSAERHYQSLFQNTNWPPSEITWQARMMAGRAAIARQGYKEAREYFTALINEGPPNIVPEALFALGDITIEEPADPANPLGRFGEAIKAFEKIPQLYPKSPLVPLAWGKIANCHFQLAAQDPKRFDMAEEFYLKVIDSESADISARSAAKVGLAHVLKAKAATKPPQEQADLVKAALNHYLDVVFYEKLLREGEQPDPFWIREAGLAAGRLLEEQRQWTEAVSLYNSLMKQLPSLRSLMERKIKTIDDQFASAKS